MPHRRLLALSRVAMLMVVCSSCDLAGGPGASGPNAPGGDFGATPGGVQDMGFARELVANGQVPPPEAFVVEGMFSEHNLPVEGPPCAQLLCLRGALGVAPTSPGTPSGWLQVGLSSTVDLATFERPPLSLVFTVDVSGSMDWEYRTPYNEYQTPLRVAKAQMERLVRTLGAGDEVAIVTYGSDARPVLPFTPGDQQEVLLTAIRALRSEGATNMEAGLETAYRLAQSARPETSRRLLLFTDVQPNVGATGASEFGQIVERGADEEIGLSVFGVGIGLDPEVFDAMSKVRGGNAFTLFGSRDVDRITEQDWPWLAVPVAFDLSVALEPGAGFEVAEGYGFPTSDKEAELSVSTVFLSERRGALLIRLEPTEALGTVTVTGSLSYETPAGEAATDTLNATFEADVDERGHAYAQPSVAKTVALALLVSGMKEASARYGEAPAPAAELMQTAATRFEADAEALGDDSLAEEVTFARKLLELMAAGAPQGTLYGEF